MTIKHILSLAAFSILVFASCRKKEDPAPDASQLTVNISSPQPSSVYYLGDTVNISATVTFPASLHGYAVELIDSASGTKLMEMEEHAHGNQFTISQKWVNNVTTATTVQARITVQIDHDGNESQKTVSFRALPESQGTVALRFDARAGNQSLVFNTGTYTNSLGSQFSVTEFSYFVTNVRLNGTGGTFTEPNSYHIINEKTAATRQFTINNVKAGTYSSITFLVGVDSARNVSGAQTGALDPAGAAAGMFWSWDTGYIQAKLEGTSPQSGATGTSAGTLIYHIGGFSGTNSGLRTVTLNFPQPLTVKSRATSSAYLSADVVKWFGSGTSAINVSSLYFLMSINADSKKIADNYAQMFTADSVRN